MPNPKPVAINLGAMRSSKPLFSDNAMKRQTIWLPLLALTLAGATPSERPLTPLPVPAHVGTHLAGLTNPCDVFGVIYVEKAPYLANFRVYIETEADYRADVVVFRETNQLFADKPGFWYLTDKRGFANFTVAFVQDRSIADFVIFYTDKDNWAGCNRR
jgi:Family of unknown function (DUF6150)